MPPSAPCLIKTMRHRRGQKIVDEAVFILPDPAIEDCDPGNYCGYSLYRASSRMSEWTMGNSAAVRAKGFTTLIVFESEDSGRRLECAVQ